MNSKFTTLNDIDVNNKKVLVRVDLNVPMKNGKVDNNERIVRSIPTIKELLSKKAKVILITHLGRPKGNGFEAEFTVKPVAEELEKLMGVQVKFAGDCIGKEAEKAVNELNAGEVLMLENVRFHKEEDNNDVNFAKQLAALGDILVSDAFSTAHRAHASNVGIAKLLPAVAGRLMEAEVEALEAALNNPIKPVVAVVGGSKVSTKLAVLNNLVKKVNTLIIGGGMGSTFLNALGINVQRSLCEHSMKDECLKILDIAKQSGCDICLPVDAQIALDLKEGVETKINPVNTLPDSYEILDAGPQSVANFKAVLDNSKTLLWNGPIGAFEIKPFDNGTNELAKHAAMLTKNGKLKSIAGGGDTVSALEKAGVYDNFTYISTAGGAFLEWMEGKDLPGVTVLKK
ncbi:phosphoglycerate kinase [Rickettsiales bacterium LUAb2]